MTWNGPDRRDGDSKFQHILTELSGIKDDIGEVNKNTAVNKSILDSHSKWLDNIEVKCDDHSTRLTTIETKSRTKARVRENTKFWLKWSLGLPVAIVSIGSVAMWLFHKFKHLFNNTGQ